MARIKGREPEEEELEIPPLRISFPKVTYVMQPDKGVEDESLPQLTVHTLEEVSTKTFVRKLAMGEKFQNWVTHKAPVVFKM
ncbi:hypothetical protein D5086_030459 [Populus alba]|uniref:Uncharacterized protein n=1 Tax=Populus alba TaxID=43335 RepID=A0ACC4ANJ7_POPAL